MKTKKNIITVAEAIVKNANFVKDNDINIFNKIKRKNSEFWKLRDDGYLLSKYKELAIAAYKELKSGKIENNCKEFWNYFLDVKRMEIQNKLSREIENKRYEIEKRLKMEEELEKMDWAKIWIENNEIKNKDDFQIDDIVASKKDLQLKKENKIKYVDKYRLVDIKDDGKLVLAKMKRPIQTLKEQKLEVIYGLPSDYIIIRKNKKMEEFNLANEIEWDVENEENEFKDEIKLENLFN